MGLGKQHAVERVFVQQRKGFQSDGMLARDLKLPVSVRQQPATARCQRLCAYRLIGL